MENKPKPGRIGVLMGGPSAEREVSLKSGQAVFEALKNEGLDVLALDFNTEEREEIARLVKKAMVEVVFIALHGRFGEDGTLQGILEELQITYTGSGVLASKLAMDKISSRKLFKKSGLSVPKSQVLTRFIGIDYSLLLKRFNSFPLVVKPAAQGSSIGISFAENLPGLKKAIALAFQYDDNILVEEYIPGRELTVGVIAEEPLPVVEVVAKNKFFDFEAKYKSEETQYIVPADLPAKTRKLVQEAGLLSHRTLNCHGFSRTDIILDQKETPFILEVNTIPGLTSHSLLPKAAAQAGMSFTQLCLRMIKLAYEKIPHQKSSQKF